MADGKQLSVLQNGATVWNAWRAAQHPEVMHPDLRGANLARARLEGADLRYTSLRMANLSGADLRRADLRNSDLFEANLREANLSNARLRQAKLRKAHLEEACLFEAKLKRANLSKAHLQKSDLRKAVFRQANLSEARLDGANLEGTELTSAILVETNLEHTNLTGSYVYGIAAWNPKLEGAIQSNLVITPKKEPNTVTVDDLEVAQFVYLLLNNEKLRHVIDTVTSKAVLILGRFTAERKSILVTIREALRQRGYLPMLFDFRKPASRNLAETVSTLAHMARFIIADITEAKSIPQELQRIIPDLPSVPVQPMLLATDSEFGMFESFKGYPWVLETYRYNAKEVLATLEDKVISPAEAKARELAR